MTFENIFILTQEINPKWPREKLHTCNITSSQSTPWKETRANTDERTHILLKCVYPHIQYLCRHTLAKKHKCSVCGDAFSQISTLKTHLQTHTQQKSHTCDICSVAYSKRSILSVHMRSHTGEKPYSCVVCRSAFFMYSLLMYMWIQTGEKLYSWKVLQFPHSKTSLKHSTCKSTLERSKKFEQISLLNKSTSNIHKNTVERTPFLPTFIHQYIHQTLSTDTQGNTL